MVATTLNSFKCTMKKLMFKRTAGRYNNTFNGKSYVNHTRIILVLSPLNHQLYTHRIQLVANDVACQHEYS
ncbi:hypothetical protein LSH36_1701g00000 [Paralvinella palmiformis]|uniref:Uncharacterized protein n=1 Tax=Paralvinella palmiformis TaxID=53620 RepID=A0AAD9IS13_9ANNE|nr:hypothetical protein LSH36_1701g00000 [Paralvinella palmiformis]